MTKREEEKPNYFQEALADFMHDAASGDAIRHMLDLGFTTDAIMARLNFPTPRERVEKTVYRYLTEQGILLEKLPVPPESLREVKMETASGKKDGQARLYHMLRGRIQENGEENSYAACPFGLIRRDRAQRLAKLFSCLTAREREYLLGIPWPPQIVYHRLNSRMLEMASVLAAQPEGLWRFYFLSSREVIIARSAKTSPGNFNA